MRRILLAVILFSLPVPAFALPAPVAAPAKAAGCNVVKEAEIRRVISDFVTRRTAPLAAEITVKRIGYSGDLKLPAGNVSYEVIAPERWEGYGNVSLALVVRVDEQVKRNLPVPVEVEALADMLVSTRTLERGEVIAQSDLAVAKRDLAHVQGRFLKNAEEAVGLRVKSAIRANFPMRSDYLERVPVVKSGQLVTIIAENDVVKLTTTGRAKGAGAVGDMITVQNISSQKDLAARVVDAMTVKVDF
jgi:flagellar basal body P-ring formation protein FlgA